MKVKLSKSENLDSDNAKNVYTQLSKIRKNDHIRKRKQKISMLRLLQASWKYQERIFFTESTLHGVRYIAVTSRPLFERLIWLACVVIGAIATIVIIISLWDKFQTNPTITGLDTDFHNWDIPFPAITICPNQPWDMQKIEKAFKTIKGKSPEIDNKKTKLFLKSLAELSLKNLKYYGNNFEDLQYMSGEEVKQMVYNVMMSCEELLISCQWKTNNYNCCNGFFPIFTENGFCYTFNSYHYEPYSAEGTNVYPEFHLRYIKETDAKWALKFTLGEIEKTQGFNISIFIHNSADIPGFDMKPHHVWDFTVNKLHFSLRETYTAENAHQLSIRQRQCIFDKEVPLDIVDVYTYTACTQQCRMNKAKSLCGCIPHFYTLLKRDTHFSLCKLKDLKCIAANLQAILSVENCVCELGCSNTIYEVDKLYPPIPSSDDNTTHSFECEFTSWPMIKYKREVLFGWVDLLVSFGGIAGLFLGFSLISGVELIYYFTIRTCCMMFQQSDELYEFSLNSKSRKDDFGQKSKPAIAKVSMNARMLNSLNIIPSDIILNVGSKSMSKIKSRNAGNKKHSSHQIITVKTLMPYNHAILPPFGIDYLN